MKKLLIVGNWKLNGNKQLVDDLILYLRNRIGNSDRSLIAIAPPAIYLDYSKNALLGSNISLASQNVDVNLDGAFTGEISVKMLKDVGTHYVIIGHSERRIHHKEDSALIAKKFYLIKKAGLTPILCIGESKEENEAGKTEEVCASQLDAIIKTQGVTALKNSVVAYEPVWAIGSGCPCKPSDAQKVHKFIRGYIAQKDERVAEEILIQHGGSISEKNAFELFQQPDIDGGLIGGSSLKPNIFSMIIEAAIEVKK
jgi:triosephosphate isomerase